MKVIFSVFLVSLFIFTGCTNDPVENEKDNNYVEDDEQQSSVEWADVMMWNDKQYQFDEEKSMSVTEQDVDQELGDIKFTVVNSTERDNPNYLLKNNEATLLEEGLIVYSIIDEDSSEYIYSEGKVYRAD
jgi:hypothetical protein